MEKVWKQIVLATTLGILVPQLVLAAGERFLPPQQIPVGTLPSAPIVNQQPQQEVPTTVVYLPVVQADGSVTVMQLEDYVRGVVLAEMPASFEMNALKAQAIAARTYVLRRLMSADKHSQGVICTDPGCCQAYLTDEDYLLTRGNQRGLEKIAQATLETAGLVITYEGDFIEATYFACSGGSTEDALAVWGEDIPYLQAVSSPGEIKGEIYEEELLFTPDQFSACLGRDLEGSPKTWIGQVTTTPGGGVHYMVIGGRVYSGVELRKLLGLRSTLFELRANDDGILIRSRGWGHRVGMSQYGADAMAISGSTFSQILAYYYPGTEIDKLSNVQ
jgi:stage II sporulation protein D